MIQTQPEYALRQRHDTKLADIVLVDDNPDDITLIRSAMSEAGVQAHVHVAEDAVHAFQLMRSLPDPPAVVILDLNLPLIKGAFILGEIREDPHWKDVPVVILTSSQAYKDVEECMRLGATAFQKKPAVYDGYISFARSLSAYL